MHRLTHRAITVVVAMSLLTMPVTYRGGAEAAHAHTIFQLWSDVRSGSFTHHAPDEAPVTSEGVADDGPMAAGSGGISGHGSEAEAAAEGADAGAMGMGHGVEADPMASDHGASTGHVDIAPREPARGSPTGLVGAFDDDAPRVGTAFTPNVRGTALVLPPMPTPLLTESFFSRTPLVLQLDGIADSPTAPPPRRAA